MSKKRVEVDGRTAFVSGAASGMGRAVALRLAAHGCPVAIVDQDERGPARDRRADFGAGAGPHAGRA